MGKKSRRSNRKGGPVFHGSNMPMILRRILQLQKDARESLQNRFFSKASHKLREGIEIMQQYQDEVLKNTGSIDSVVFEVKNHFLGNFIMVEYDRCRFDKVVQIYYDIQRFPENEKNLSLSFTCEMYGQLAMLRLDASNENKERIVTLIETRISEGMTDPIEVTRALEAVRTLRNMKEYDAAIALGEKLERLTGNGDANIENAVSYLERYRTDYQSKSQTDSEFPLVRFPDGGNTSEDDAFKKAFAPRHDIYFMMIAQKNYLCHQVDDKEISSQLYSDAVLNVERYLEWKWHCVRHCHTCNQADTATEVQLVCGGCRVACYCSLDHQRLTWKKDAIQGMRIGHEILCPLMKAYRKWKLVKKKDSERSTKLRRRLDRECEYFLSHGLGLKDKCFREEDMQKYYSLQNTSG